MTTLETQLAEIELFWATPQIFFENETFQFFSCFIWYKSTKMKKTHIFYNGKTNRKYLQIPNLQALTLGRIKKITLYLDTEFRALKTNLNMVYIQNLQLLLTHKTCPTSK